MAETSAPSPPRPRRMGKAFLFVALTVLLGGAGGRFFWWPQGQAAPPHAGERVAGAAVLALEPFLVNLADRDAPRFLRITMKLVIDDERFAKAFGNNLLQQSRVRSSVLELLTTQESSKLVTPEGKAELKKQIVERAGAVLHTEVRDVLFTDFVVQF